MSLGLLAVVLLIAWVSHLTLQALRIRFRAVERMARSQAEPDAIRLAPTPVDAGALRRWLALAGFRTPGAPVVFLMSGAAALLMGVLAAFIMSRTVTPWMVENVIAIPAGVGEGLAAIAEAGPWMLFLLLALAPILVVRAARRARVRAIEQDLPLVLELFSTLAEAGLGFDAVLVRIIQAQPAERPLTVELAGFQRDLRAGVPRVQALRLLSRRVNVMAFTSLIAAIIQAEHVGGSIAETLRHQANDLRSRRREHALLLAQSLPVKLVVPLVLCFLPGIFFSTLGPVLYQMVEVANSVLRPVGP
jgi:Flp pilus assembly protein TadB